MKIMLLFVMAALMSMAQTVESRSVMLKGTSLPASCVVGERFFKTDATAGENLYLCTSTNTWTQVSGTGGTTEPSGLACGVTLTSTTRLTVFNGASSSAPCIVGGTRFTSSATFDTSGTAATGTYRLEVRAGAIYARLVGATTGLSTSGITMEASSASFSATGVPLWSWDQSVAGTWDAGTGTDMRSWLTTQIVPAAGSLMTSSDSSGVRTLAVDAQNLYANNYCRSTTGNDTYTCDTTPATVAYTRGRCWVLDADTANTGTASLQINGVGSAQNILRRNGDALSDGDITANKPINVCHDGTQLIIQGDGGGSSGLSGNYWSKTIYDGPVSHLSYVTVGTTPYVWHITNGPARTVNKISFYIDPSNPLGTSCTGGTCGITWGLYDAGCSTKLAQGTPYTTSAGTAAQSVTLTSGVALSANTVYCVMVGTDSSAIRLSAPDHNSSVAAGILNVTTVRQGTCANGTSNNGASLSLPSSCGTITSGGNQFNAVLLP